MYDVTTNKFTISDLMVKLKAEKLAANELQKRRHEDWNDNYDLYRNKVKTNRLTQRQAVNIPLMKETIKTILSSIDDAPNVEWVELAGDEEKELIYQEVWSDKYKTGKFELEDIKDKKNVLLYGIAPSMLNIVEDGCDWNALDPYDIVFDPLMEPGKVETARFVIRQNIFRSVREIVANDRYTDAGKESLKLWIDAPQGITQSADNKKHWEEKMQRMKGMGVSNKDFPYYAGGDRVVNLTEHHTKVWNTTTLDWERRVIVYAEDTIELLNMSLMELIGVDFWPFVVWAEDPETQDIYPDAVADLVRTPNKVLNVWFSQMIENRTLRNFNMHWFLPGQNYQPTTYTPGPGVMLPAPPGDDINKVIKQVEVGNLDDTLAAISAITQIVERGSGATALEKGQPEGGQQTLGEVKILVGKAMERTIGMAKFYRMARYEMAWKWNRMMQANAPKYLKLYKTGRSGKIFPKRVYAGDWVSEAGYEPMVRSTSEQEQEQIKTLQKFMFVMTQFPNNQALKRIAQRRELESLDLTPEELKEIEDAEKNMPPPTAPAPTPAAANPAGGAQDTGQIQQLLSQLTQ